MIVTSKTVGIRRLLWDFLGNHGVRVMRSEDFQAIGRFSADGSSLLGAVGYNGFIGRTCSIHAAGIGNWVSREFIRATFEYPFVQLDMEHLFATVAANNSKALRFDRRMGFTDFGRVANGYERGVDLIILTMAKKDCRWIAGEKTHDLKAA